MSLSEAEARVDTAVAAEDVGGSLLKEAWRRLRRDPVAITGGAMVALFVLVAVIGPWIAPYGPSDRAGAVTPTMIPGPSSQFWFGLDDLGRDELSRVILGARQSLLVGVVSLVLGMIGGLTLGVLAGALGGWVDSLIMRIIDIVLAVPGLLFAIGVAATLGRSLQSVMIAIAVVNVPIFARLLRGQMLSQREADYVAAATSVGLRRRVVVFRHILPNSISPVIVQGTLTLATAIIDAAGLAFLGLGGTDPSVPEWGRMLADSQDYLSGAIHLAVFPGLAIVFAALGFTLFGERLREALDPKYRR